MRIPFDQAAYEHRTRTGPCFICAALRNDPDYRHHMVYADDRCAAFLNRYPPLLGYTLVVPRALLAVTDAEQAALAARLQRSVRAIRDDHEGLADE